MGWIQVWKFQRTAFSAHDIDSGEEWQHLSSPETRQVSELPSAPSLSFLYITSENELSATQKRSKSFTGKNALFSFFFLHELVHQLMKEKIPWGTR